MEKVQKLEGRYGSYIIEYSGAAKSDFDSCICALEAEGYTESARNSIADSVFATHRKDTLSVHSYYLPRVGIIRQVYEECAAPVYSTPQRDVAEPCIYASSVSDRSYFIRLSDNTLVIIDGGWRGEDMRDFDHYALFDGFVKELQGICGCKTVTVSAWFVTHPHLDHANFLEFVHEYGYDKYFKVERIVRNFPDLRYVTPNRWDDPQYIDVLENALKKWQGTDIITARTGMRFSLSGMTFDVYMTPDDNLANGIDNLNATSLLIMQDFCGKRILWTGDMSSRVSENALAMHGDALKCDAVQVSHHGWGGAGTLEFYETCAAGIQLWTNSEYGFRFADKNQGYGKTKIATAVYDMPCCRRHMFCNGIKLQALSLSNWNYDEDIISKKA